MERDRRKTRFIEAVKHVEEALEEELGPQWRSRVEVMDRYGKIQLARRLQERGIANPVALARVLKVSGRDLEKVELFHEESVEDEDRAVAVAADRDVALRLRETAIQPSKPILAKEIQDYAWSHNLYHDTGKLFLLRFAKYISFDDEDLGDSERAFRKVAKLMDELEKLREDVQLLEKLRAEKEAMDILLTVSIDYLEKAVNMLNEYYNVNKMYQEMLSKTPLCSSCRSKILRWILFYQASGSMPIL
jgi:hypothetical protein